MRRATTRRLRNRKGVTLVMVAMLLTVLLGVAAIALDMSRLYLYKAQLQNAADAGALTGAFRVLNGDVVYADDSAVVYAKRNPVELTDPTLTTDDIVPGYWDFDTRTWEAYPGDWANPKVNAVRATTSHKPDYTFGRVFGLTDRRVDATAVAAIGSVTSSSCLKPWAIPYANLLWSIGRPYQTNDDLDHRLTVDDVAQLRQNTAANNIAFKIAANGDEAEVVATDETLPGSYYAVRFPPIEYADGTRNANVDLDPGGDKYGEAIAGCTSTPVAVDDWLISQQGVITGKTRSGVEALCGGLGTGGECINPARIAAPIYSVEREMSPGLPEFKVKYIGGFVITKYQGGAVYGYFDGFAVSGKLSNVPGPLSTSRLVR